MISSANNIVFKKIASFAFSIQILTIIFVGFVIAGSWGNYDPVWFAPLVIILGIIGVGCFIVALRKKENVGYILSVLAIISILFSLFFTWGTVANYRMNRQSEMANKKFETDYAILSEKLGVEFQDSQIITDMSYDRESGIVFTLASGRKVVSYEIMNQLFNPDMPQLDIFLGKVKALINQEVTLKLNIGREKIVEPTPVHIYVNGTLVDYNYITNS